MYKQNNIIFRFVQESVCLFIYKLSKNILISCSIKFCFHCVGVPLHYFYLVLMIRDLFSEYDKDYVVILVYVHDENFIFQAPFSF